MATSKVATSQPLRREVVLAVAERDGLATPYAAAYLKKNLKFALAAVQRNGMALWYAVLELQKDRQFVIAAVQRNHWRDSTPRLS